jgi:hypothetical protein
LLMIANWTLSSGGCAARTSGAKQKHQQGDK